MPKPNSRKKNKGRRAGQRRELDMFDQTANVARRAYRGVQYLRSVLNPELKYFSTSGTCATGTTATLAYLTGMAEGSDQNTRNGVSIRLSSWEFTVSLRLDVANAVPHDLVRLALVVDTQARAAVFAVSSYLTTVTDPLSLRNEEERPRFIVLYDTLTTLSGVSSPFHVVKANGAYDGHVRYVGSSGASTHFGNGQLALIVLGLENTHPSFVNYNTRVHFYDN